MARVGTTATGKTGSSPFVTGSLLHLHTSAHSSSHPLPPHQPGQLLRVYSVQTLQNILEKLRCTIAAQSMVQQHRALDKDLTRQSQPVCFCRLQLLCLSHYREVFAERMSKKCEGSVCKFKCRPAAAEFLHFDSNTHSEFATPINRQKIRHFQQ